MENQIGIQAGRVWKYLNEHGAVSFKQLEDCLMEDDAPMKRVILAMAVGWLARENKVSIFSDGRGKRYRLNLKLK